MKTNSTTIEEIKEYKGYKDLDSLLKNPQKAIRLGLFNADKHVSSSAFFDWEQSEPGCTFGMISAYKEMLKSIAQPLSFDVINNIRKALQPVKKYGRYTILKEDVNAINRKEMCFGLPENLDEKDIARINEEASDSQKKYNLITLPYKAQLIYIEEKKIKKGAMLNSSSCYDENNHIGNPKECAIEIIEHYTNLVDKKLNDIIDLAKDLERAHPYSDFNCRTFCILIFNRELIKNNFPPAVLEDPNVFDWQTLTQLQDSLKVGQKNFENLFNNGYVHEKDNTNEQWFEYINIQLTDHKEMSSILYEFQKKISKSKSWSHEKWSEYNEQSKELQNKYSKFQEQVNGFKNIDIEYYNPNYDLNYDEELVQDALAVIEKTYKDIEMDTNSILEMLIQFNKITKNEYTKSQDYQDESKVYIEQDNDEFKEAFSEPLEETFDKSMQINGEQVKGS